MTFVQIRCIIFFNILYYHRISQHTIQVKGIIFTYEKTE